MSLMCNRLLLDYISPVQQLIAMGRLKLLRFGFGAPQLFNSQQVDLKSHGDGFENSLRNVASHQGLAYLCPPQVGQLYRILVMLKRPHLKSEQWTGYKNLKNSHFKAFMNFQLHDKSTKEKQMWEECVGYPGIRLKMLRSEKVKVKYRSEKKFDDLEQQLTGFEATIAQQASDHLQALDPLILAKGVDIRDEKLKEEHGDLINKLFIAFAERREKDLNNSKQKWNPFRRTTEFNRLRRELMFSVMENVHN